MDDKDMTATPQECPECKKRGKTWRGSDPRCAFQSETFSSDNYQCATMNILRDLCEESRIWNEDSHCAAIPFGVNGFFLVLSWYKSRGRTDGAWVVHCDGMEALTLTQAAEIVAVAPQVSP